MEKQLTNLVVNHEAQAIRKIFKDPKNTNVCIDYQTFLKHFTLSENNFQEENQNIIDVHLRYRWWVRQKMSPYKWIPIVLMTPILFRSIILFVAVPYFMTRMFDHYFQKFFLWRYRKVKIINVKGQFETKISKMKNKHRRVSLYSKIKDNLIPDDPQQKELPERYIKFGEFTEYVFHGMVDGKEMSNFEHTTLFQHYCYAKSMYWRIFAPQTIWNGIKKLFNDFLQYRDDPFRTRFHLNTVSLTDRPDIKNIQVYALEDNIDDTIRRWYQLWRFIFKGSLQPCQFKLWEHVNFTEYIDIFEPVKYNAKRNGGDLALYYGILAIPKILDLAFRRR